MVAIDFIVGIIGNVISVISYLAPIGQFAEIVKTKSAENYDGSPYITSLLSCGLWTFYGVLDPDDGMLVVTVSALGVVSQVIYLALLLLYYPKDKRVKCSGFIVVDMICVGVIIAVTMTAFEDGSRRTFVGIVCATFSVIAYASPLTVVYTVIQTKTAEYMPVFLIFTFWLNGVTWLVFALLVSDFFILVPNAVGILLGSIQLLVYFIYRNSTPPPPPSKVIVDSSREISEDGIVLQSTEKNKELAEVKNQCPPNGSKIRNTSLTRQFSLKDLHKGVSLTRNQSRSVSRSVLLNETDLESGRT